jgi:hypothetical protein
MAQITKDNSKMNLLIIKKRVINYVYPDTLEITNDLFVRAMRMMFKSKIRSKNEL